MVTLASLASCRPKIGVLLYIVIGYCFFFFPPVYIDIMAIPRAKKSCQGGPIGVELFQRF